VEPREDPVVHPSFYGKSGAAVGRRIEIHGRRSDCIINLTGAR
jgi:hypothetical protein